MRKATTCWLSDICSDTFIRPLTGDRTTEVAVIGGGIMGVATTYWLSRMGIRVELLEARGLGEGATGRNAGLVLHGVSPLEDPRLLTSVLSEEGIACGYSTPGHLSLASSEGIWQKIQSEARNRPTSASPLAALAPGSCEDLLNTRLSGSFFGGRWYPGGAVVHSAKLVYGLAKAAASRTATVSCETPVLDVQTSGAGVWVRTARGVVKADAVVHAAASGVAHLLPEFKSVLTPVRAQMMATKPIRPLFEIGLGVDWGDVYGRQLADGRFVLGGLGAKKTTFPSEDAERTDPVIQNKLRRFLSFAFPGFPKFEVSQRWAGLMDCTADGKPVIGRHPGRPNQWLIAGFNGHGMPAALGAGRALAESVATGTVLTCLAAYDPGRFHPLLREDTKERGSHA